MNKARTYLENLVIVAIVLVLIQTFLSDFAVIAGWPWDIRLALLFAGLAFDVFFTIEFLTRLYDAFINRRTGVYFWYERGWVDLVASIPLLLLISGPAALAYWSGTTTVVGAAGILNVLKVVKAIRIARILRLLRLLKIFSRIRNTESEMAQRHVAKIATVAVTTVIVSVLVLSSVFSVLNVPGLEVRYQERSAKVADRIHAHDLSRNEDVASLHDLADLEESLLLVLSDGRTVFSRYTTEQYEKNFGPSDFGFVERDGLRIFFDLKPLNEEQARTSLVYFAVIVLLVIAFMFYYSPHFALTVSDPIHVMRRGLNEKGYNLEVKIPSLYRDDDVYRLGRLYNEVYLPLKDRAQGGDGPEVLGLKLEDIRDMLDE